MQINYMIAGTVLLLFGRKLYWLFVGIAGFLFGMEVAPLFFLAQPQWLQIAIALGLGCIGAVLAIIAQRVAFAFAGFFTGMYLVLTAGELFMVQNGNLLLLLAFAAGIIGAVTAILVLDTAITLFSCLVGAGAVAGQLNLAPTMHLAFFIFLAAAGFMFQEYFFGAGKKGREFLENQ